MVTDNVLFAENLKTACATMGSVSQFCRQYGFNRQQFNRYISGQSRPSQHNRYRIASAFGLSASDFDLPAAEFQRLLAVRRKPYIHHDFLDDAFPGDLAALRRYEGFYQTWYISHSWPGRIVCAATHLRERGGKMLVTSVERIEAPLNGIRQHTRYDGLAAYQYHRIFVVERTRRAAASFGQTILLPFEIHQQLYLRGVTMGISWRHDNQPYAARMIWRFYGPDADRRRLLSRCGAYRVDAREVPPAVSSYLTADEAVLVTV